MTTQILLGVCGGIAAYKSAELVRLLCKQGCDVRVVMTQSAMHFVSPLTFQALSGNPVSSQLLNEDEENAMGHINLARWADIMIVAPASANTIAKLSLGLADDLLSTLYLASNCPVYVVPAMNQVMWNKTVTQENIQRLKNHDVQFIGPEAGEQACGDIGLGRMTEPSDICMAILHEQEKHQLLSDLSILISAGPTREPLDPVRYITNHSSGKMGYALAKAAVNMGAKVTLVSGPVQLSVSKGVDLIHVETAEQMYQVVVAEAIKHTIYIGAAAVADYSPVYVHTEKIKKQSSEFNTINLKKTKDIVAKVASLQNLRPFVVGFSAETHNLEHYAKNKLKQKKLDLIAANWVGKGQGGFNKNENELQVYWHSGHKTLKMTHKDHLAKQLIALIVERMNEKNTA